MLILNILKCKIFVPTLLLKDFRLTKDLAPLNRTIYSAHFFFLHAVAPRKFSVVLKEADGLFFFSQL